MTGEGPSPIWSGRGRPVIGAHRGASAAVSGNTVQAFELAIAMGAEVIELDVRRTGDGTLVVRHDPEVDGIPIGSIALAELHRHAPAVPTLEHALARTRGRIGLDIELKEPGYASDVVDLVHARFGHRNVGFSSFDPETVRAIVERFPAAQVGLIVARGDAGGVMTTARGSGATFVAVAHRLMDQAGFGDALRSAGLPLVVWTVNEPLLATRFLLDPAVEVLLTDRPDLVLALRAATAGVRDAEGAGTARG